MKFAKNTHSMYRTARYKGGLRLIMLEDIRCFCIVLGLWNALVLHKSKCIKARSGTTFNAVLLAQTASM
jgi:hypothetical protein